MHRLQELVRLHRMGTKVREIARLLQMSPNTERDYRQMLAGAGLLDGPVDALPTLGALKTAVEAARRPADRPTQERSSIEQWEARIQELLKLGLTAQPIYDRLRLEEDDFSGSYWSVRRMCRRLKQDCGVQAWEVAIPVRTAAGEIAQVDFGYVGKLMCPTEHVLRRAWVFVMSLGHSRHMYAEVVFDQRAETWMALHERAFAFFGGVPATLVPDNLKAAVIRAAFTVDATVALHRSYRELAQHYGFKVDPAPPYSPEKKGKVESAVKYVKRNALAGRHGEALDKVNATLKRWLVEVAGQRRHGSTGRKPLEVFADVEQRMLRPLPSKPYEAVLWKKAKVHRDSHVCFDKRLYSVPWRWVGSSVWVRANRHTVTILGDDVRIATHRRRGPGRCSTIESHLPEHRRELRHRSTDYWQQRAAHVGPETGWLIKEIFESDDVLSQLRKVQAIVTHLETYPVERAEAASKRARFFGTYSYGGIKGILRKALDLEPLPIIVTPLSSAGESPRFARSISDLVAYKLQQEETHHESH